MANWWYISPLVPGAQGGQSAHVLASLRAIAARRPLTLIAPGTPDLVMTPRTHVLPLPVHAPREIVWQLRLARTLVLAGSRPAIVYARAGATSLGVVAAARALGATVVLECNGLPHLERGARPAARLLYSLLWQLDMRAADGIVAVTPELAALARRRGARAVHIAPNGADTTRVVPQDQRAARAALGLDPAARLVVFAGSLSAWQGIETLLAGVRLARRTDPRIQLVLAGDGPLAAQIAARTTGDTGVVLAGRLPHTRALLLSAAADAVAVPLPANARNRATGVAPLKVAEALALGVPLLASDLPGLRFIGTTGLGANFAAGDPHDLARALGELLRQTPDAQQAMRQRARVYAVQHLDWQRITDGIIAFAEGLARPPD